MPIQHTPYPLEWPLEVPRARARAKSKFKTRTVAQALDHLRAELKRFGAIAPVISTNVECRLDGIPYSGRREPDDPGVAVYFSRRDTTAGPPKAYAMAIDHYRKVADNLHALANVIACYREIERHGGPMLLGQATAGFLALPQKAGTARREWWQTLGFASIPATYEEAQKAYRARIGEHHPDQSGDDVDRAVELNLAREQARKHFGI